MNDALSWAAWKETTLAGDEPGQSDPYLHWWKSVDGNTAYAKQHLEAREIDALSAYFVREETERRKNFPFDGKKIPVPTESRNPYWSPLEGDDIGWTDEALDAAINEGLEGVTKDTVIAGIIDAGIGLGHRRFRLKDGKTRFLATWQQAATWDIDKQRYLPFGRELYWPQINDLLEKHSGGDIRDGALDEEAFNRAASLVEPHRGSGLGQRDLDHRAAHGTHVLDLFSGYDPSLPEQEELAERTRIIGVNLPTPFVHGPAVNFLQYFAILAIERIVDLADRLWQVRFGNATGRFPIIINMSYGMQAGPKNGSLPFEKAVESLVHKYGQSDRDGLLRVVMPAGNKNLARGTASFNPKKDEVKELQWRILPSDHTSNVAEIWTRETDVGESRLRPGDFRLSLTPPGHKTLEVPVLDHEGTDNLPNAFSDLVNKKGQLIARVYCRLHEYVDLQNVNKQRLQTILCICPTTTVEKLFGVGHGIEPEREFVVGLAPSGVWRIGLMHKIEGHERIDVHIQADTAGQLHSSKALSSYFDDPDYQRFDAAGRVMDTAPYGSDQIKTHIHGPVPKLEPAVTRFGSQNPLATSHYFMMIGGYEIWDGRPAPYSASGRDKDRSGQLLDVDAAMPCEDNASTHGLLAAGARDGSRVSYRGTSMSSALAARLVVEAIIENGAPTPLSYGQNWLTQQGTSAESPRHRPEHYSDAAAAKVGHGRLRLPGSYVRGRLGVIDR